MRTENPPTIFREQYTPPAYFVDTIDMGFDLDPVETRVITRIALTRNVASDDHTITLSGDELRLISISMNGEPMDEQSFQLVDGNLLIANAPDQVDLEIETALAPQHNTSLMGLYVSSGNFFTQCEAEGFRKITFFPDRPDVMAKYTVMLRADKATYPVLLSNGNLIDHGDLENGRHFALWEDPFKKPSYLFALVAGKLVCQEETMRLKSGRDVLLQVWVEPGNLDKTQHAIDSLKNSITWDEERFGLELDLDRFMIVAVGDFNMGAMENKGLNVFNTKFVLANPRIATDVDYANIEAVVGHEYFHNWTGNRVTCRDWFQLSLKEGLTVIRNFRPIWSVRRRGARSSASRMCGYCVRPSFRKMLVRWRTRCGLTPISKSIISIPSRFTKRALKSSACTRPCSVGAVSAKAWICTLNGMMARPLRAMISVRRWSMPTGAT
jgi:aminopeptidase N